MPSVPLSALAAVDFGDALARAVAVAGLIADRCGAATLRLLHAETTEAPAYFTHDQIEALERQQQATRLQAEHFLVQFGRKHTRHPLSAVVKEASPADAILREATNANLVVMGTHGRHRPKRWWLGSVAERVLRDVDRPRESLFSRALVHAAAPLPRTSAWLSDYGEPLVRFSTVPILFVPETVQGASS